MSKLEKLIKELCPDGVEYKAFCEFGTMIRGNGLQKKDFTEEGIGCIHYGQIYTYYGTFTSETKTFVSEELANKLKKVNTGDLIIAITSENIEDVCKCVAWLGENEIVTGGHAAIFKHNQDPKYLSYCFQTADFFSQKRKIANGTKVIEVSPQKLEQICIPLPPLPVQREIVRILDNFKELTAELTVKLTAELTARKQQYEYYRGKLLTFGDEVEWKMLGDIGKVSMCKRIFKEQTQSNGEIPFYKIGTFGKEPDAYISQELFEEYKQKYSYPKKGEILISASGTIGRTVIFDGAPSYFQDSNIVWIANDEKHVLNKFLFHIYKIIKWAVSEGGTISRLYNDNIKKTIIPVPSIEEQQRIVAILDRFDSICTDITQDLPAEIEARKKQYEYYRDKLLTFKEIEK
ncbi:restriction endonuclease subunit S [Clostridium sp. 2-1]|uniref:restriction endonuclease subunit S n=1 Tax=Clostridium TaxID=1485 RepID=UPI000CDB9A8A|nr:MULTISPECIES: restriction endonuclease subunit S [Clostridium]MBN7572792.1 restriction endonuclease subunit S [Clostridium beijerinckii]MBN7578132.1 restriction endonuclease subunit S [Clostridium beijerinckii]MBN7582566.1 restriction endonuclease subunit S [Clostridium beijerinckii]MBO0521806.1 restriction endonuclease subunit S [Clostridium beijerinckii]POO89161.1 restriction endonuclease subunit S [Clostridium sp. 2-1]